MLAPGARRVVRRRVPADSFLRSGGLMACTDACGHAGDWRRPPTRGSPALGPRWPPRRSASMWNTLMTLT